MEILLKDICIMQSGGTPAKTNTQYFGGKIPWVIISDFKTAERGIIYNTKETLTEEGLQAINGRFFKKGTLLFAMYGSVGKTSFLGVDASINQAILGIRPIDDKILNIKYLKYWLDYNKDFLHSQSRGAILENLSLSIVQKQKIKLPDLETQNKIVTILEKVTTILDKRKEIVNKYEKLLQSVLLYTFGNPMKRPNKWSIKPIKDCLISISAGKSYNGDNKKKLEEDEIGVLKVSAVSRGVFNPLEYKAVKRNLITKSILQPYKNDLLFSRANTLELVGMTCIVDENHDNLFLSDKIWKVETDETIIKKVYLHYVLQNKDMRKTFLSIATGSSGSMLNISKKKFEEILIPYPPIELQKRFEDSYFKYVELSKKLQLSACYFNDLYNSLSQLLFKGEFKFGSGIDLEVLLKNDFKFFKKNSNNKTIQLLLERIDKDELNENQFYDTGTYDKAKSFVFELIKEGTIQQVFDKKDNQVKLKFR